ncbi:REP-associated tyrosine transposase [Duganella aceris]|uniref:Transposase n=1 Tax=Duganella aceris TaxID=2703883 RepID=A0ABX0FJB6_9BURK|nr:transposase [Duganella aceris]NGZ84666.1 transposase [Duganella aceris]
MNRPLRIEFAGALYHVTSRGDRQAAIFLDDVDRTVWMAILAQVCARYNFVIHGFCLMTNHYHVVLETIEGNLSQGMRVLNGTYSQYFNRRHELLGHVFQGRYHAILVQRESYLLELTRYVVLNPLRAGIVTSLEDWPWSSHAYMMGSRPAPAWLDTSTTLQQFGGERATAIHAYHRFVLAGIGCGSPLKDLRHQLILGDDAFIAKTQGGALPGELVAVAKTQRRAVSLTLAEYQQRYPTRDEAMARAYHSTAYTMEQIATHFRVSAKTVSRAVNRFEQPSPCPNVGTDT